MIYSGSLLLLELKVQDKWHVVGGMKVTKFVLNRQFIASNNISNGMWRELLEGAGLKAIEITATGSFSNSLAEQELSKIALEGESAEYRLSLASGKSLTGKFQITYYERIGEVNEEENYRINLASSGETIYDTHSHN